VYVPAGSRLRDARVAQSVQGFRKTHAQPPDVDERLERDGGPLLWALLWALAKRAPTLPIRSRRYSVCKWPANPAPVALHEHRETFRGRASGMHAAEACGCGHTWYHVACLWLGAERPSKRQYSRAMWCMSRQDDGWDSRLRPCKDGLRALLARHEAGTCAVMRASVRASDVKHYTQDAAGLTPFLPSYPR